MVTSITNDYARQMILQMCQEMNAADADGISGLSASELSAVVSGGDANKSAFLQSLSEQFENLDSDKNGQLSLEEISQVQSPTGPMGPPPGMPISSGIEESANAKDIDNPVENSSSDNDFKKLVKNLLDSLLESFSESFDKKAFSDSKKDVQNEVNSLTSSADIDKDGKLSLSELVSVNSGDGSIKSKFAKDLADKFDSLDKDGDGELSKAEMEAAKLEVRYSKQELAAMSKSNEAGNEAFSSFGSPAGNLSGSFFQKLLSNYQGNGLSDFVSSVSLKC